MDSLHGVGFVDKGLTVSCVNFKTKDMQGVSSRVLTTIVECVIKNTKGNTPLGAHL